MAYGPTNNVVEYELSEHIVVDGVTITGDGDTESPLVFTGKIPGNANSAAVGYEGVIRYRTDATNSYVDMCMKTGVNTYAWVNILTNTWSET
jgi:hypothetical protein